MLKEGKKKKKKKKIPTNLFSILFFLHVFLIHY